MDKVNEYLKRNNEFMTVMGKKIQQATKRIVCNDGFSISVQANNYTYCTPREDEAWPYSKVELGFPSAFDELIDEYAHCDGTLETVYGYVPIDIVNELIEKHGGIKE